MSDVYTITMIDQASAQARRVQNALSKVAVTSNAAAIALRKGSKAERMFAGEAVRLARAELGAARSIDAANRHLAKMNKLAGARSTARFQRLRGVVGALSGALGIGFVKALASGSRSMLEAAGGAQKFHGTLEAIGDGAPKLSDNWETELLRLRLPIEQGRKDVSGLLAAFKDVNNLNAGRAVNDIMKLASALSLTTQETRSFNKVFRDIGGKGKVQREELTGQLAEIGIGVTIPGFLSEVARTQKVTYAEAEKMLGKGKISAEIGIPALIRATANARIEGGAPGLDAAATGGLGGIGATLTNLDNAGSKLREAIGSGLVSVGALDQIDRLAGALFKLASTNPALIGTLAVVLGGFAAAIGGLATLAGGVFLISTALGTLSAAAGVLTGVLVPGAVAAWSFLAPFLIAAAPFLAAGAALIFLGLQIDRLWTLLGGWETIWPAIKGFFSELSTSAMSLGAEALSWGANIIQGLVDGITGGASRAVDAIQGVAGGVISGAKDVFGIQSPSRAFVSQGHFIDEGLAMGIEDHADLAFNTAEDLAEGAIMAAELAGESSQDPSRLSAVAAAAGNSINSSNASTRGGAGGAVTVGPISIDARGADAGAISSLKAFFEDEFATMLERQLEGSGA